jgi:hypothetical protein
MSRVLIVCHGYFGDHLFASSIAKKLKDQKSFDEVDYLIGFPQIKPFLELNPYINRVIFTGQVTPAPVVDPAIKSFYDKVIQLGPLSFHEPPCIEFQRIAGVQQPSPDFTVYTDPVYDLETQQRFAEIKSSGMPIVAIMDNWQPKAFGFTKEEYDLGINVPYLGYGGRLRDIPKIVSALQEKYVTVMVGAPEGVTQFDTSINTNIAARTLIEEASVLKYCDYFVGAEGGLANLAAGVGCKTILTSDFVHQLYGYNGVIRKIPEPKLGPRYYFSTGHIDLDPYLTDDEVISAYTQHIESK